MPRRASFIATLSLAAACLASTASAQYAIDWFTVDGGGMTVASGSSYTLGGTIGQPDAGSMAGGSYSLLGGFWRGGASVLGVDDGPLVGAPPLTFALHPGYPNPLLHSSIVAFDLPQAQRVRMRVFDANGRVARTLVEGTLAAGHHRRTWDGNDQGGRRVAAGIYFLQFDSQTDRASRKLVVLN